MAFARINYHRRSLQKASSVSVVFPDDSAIPRPWSVFYLLHGLSDDDTIWMRRTSIERYVEGLPLVVVMPDGGRGWYTNAVVGHAYEDDLIKDIGPELARIFGKAPKGGPEDPFGIVVKLDHGRIPALRIDCGKADFLIEQNRAFHRHLESMQIAHE
jgi:S-formylglutathione hydrolase FrmB